MALRPPAGVEQVSVREISTNIAGEISAKSATFPNFAAEKGEDPRAFVRLFERQCKGANLHTDHWAAKFPTCLKEAALEWYFVKVEKANVNVNVWKDVKDAFQSFFLPDGITNHLLKQLRDVKLRINETLLAYQLRVLAICADHDEIMKDHPMPEASKIDYLMNGLPEEIRNQMTLYKPKTIDEFTDYSKRCEQLRNLSKIKSCNSKGKTVSFVGQGLSDHSTESPSADHCTTEVKKLAGEVANVLSTQFVRRNNTGKCIGKKGNNGKTAGQNGQKAVNKFHNTPNRGSFCTICQINGHQASSCNTRTKTCTYCKIYGHTEKICRN